MKVGLTKVPTMLSNTKVELKHIFFVKNENVVEWLQVVQVIG